MQCVVTAGELVAALKTIRPAIASKSVLPILNHVLLNARDGTLTLSATNLETSLRTSIPAEVREPGATTASEARLASWVELQDGKAEIALKADGKSLAISVGRNRAKLGVADPDDFPPLPTLDTEAITLPAEQLARGIALALPSVMRDGFDNVKGGLLLRVVKDRLSIVGVDGFRLGLSDIPLDTEITEPVSLLIPRVSAVALAGLLHGGDVSVGTNEANTLTVFVIGATTLSTRLLGGVFPDWQRVIPLEFSASCTVPAAELLNQVRAGMLADDENRVHFEITAEGLTVRGRAAGPLEEHEGHVSGESVGVAIFALNGAQALDAIRALATSTVTLASNGPQSPVLLTGPDGATAGTQLLMPLHVAAKNRREVAA